MGTICIYALFFIAAWGSIHGITGAVLKRKSEAYTGWGLLGWFPVYWSWCSLACRQEPSTQPIPFWPLCFCWVQSPI